MVIRARGGSFEDVTRNMRLPLIGAVTALSHIRHSCPDATKEEVEALLLDAVEQKRIGFLIPKHALRWIEEPGPFGLMYNPVYNKEIIMEARFPELDVIEAFPAAAPDLLTVAPTKQIGRPGLPVPELIAEMHRMHAAGRLDHDWSSTARKLVTWRERELPERKGGFQGIRNNQKLLAVYRTLTGKQNVP